MTPLEQAILRTVAYFDMFSYPLTAWEVWKWLFGEESNELRAQSRELSQTGSQPSTLSTPPRYTELLDILAKSTTLQEKLGEKSGLIFLKGRQETVAIRQERYRLALQKFTRARRFARVLSYMPFIRAVAVCNSLGLANARAESDIDLFIIAKPGHVWSTRLFAAGWAAMRHIRPRTGHRADTACLSFFITEDVGDLSKIRNADDPYFTVWLATLVPLFDPASHLERLWQENAWVAHALPHAAPRALAMQRRISPSFLQAWGEAVVSGKWFERWAERVQQRRLPANLRALANRDTRVVLNRAMLKFHDNDRRDAYAKQFQLACQRIGICIA